MQLGIIGLGRMGGNIARRLQRAGHEIVVYDLDQKTVEKLATEGMTGATSLNDLISKMKAPRSIWVMLPAGKITEDTIFDLADHIEKGDTIIDGGNTMYKDDIRRAKTLSERGIHYVDVGTSGGVWGLERGYCMMIGGDKEAVDRIDPILKALAPGIGNIDRTKGREHRDPRAEEGYLHCGPAGSGHFVKMVHNGIEYGIMQAYAEGFDIMKNKNSTQLPEDQRFDLHMADIAEVWRRGSVVASWLLDLTATGPRRRREPGGLHRQRLGFRRRPLDHRGRDRGSRAGRSALGLALRPIPVTPGAYVRGKAAVGDAFPVRWPSRVEDSRGLVPFPLLGKVLGMGVQARPASSKHGMNPHSQPLPKRGRGVDCSSPTTV